MHKVHSQLVLGCFHIYIFVHPHVHNNYVPYIAAMQPYFS